MVRRVAGPRESENGCWFPATHCHSLPRHLWPDLRLPRHYDVLGLTIESITKQTLGQYLQAKINALVYQAIME